MKKIAIMQPYFFPYIGYFQLINSVNKFIFYEDVNYIKNGWINRNRLLLANDIRYITIPLDAASSFKKINETRIKNSTNWQNNILSKIHQSYAKTPYYKSTIKIVEEVLNSHDEYISTLAKNSITSVVNYLEMDDLLFKSSTIYENQSLKSIDRILDICRIEQATEYWNLPGGKYLYNNETFNKNNLELKFIEPSITPYQQTTPGFQSYLSIIDVLMLNNRESIKKMITPRLV